jgi:hypothetical protein
MENAERWKTFVETDEFRKVYVKKTPEQRNAAVRAERDRTSNFEDEE